jgi:hypothetical protein
VTFTVDRPVKDEQEAEELAKARLYDMAMGYITAEAICNANPPNMLIGLRPGKVVTVDVPDERFKGKYMIVGATHRYTMGGEGGGGETAGDGGYTVVARLRRSAEKPA